MSSTGFAHRLLVESKFPTLLPETNRQIHVGFLGPLSGPVQSWGLPGLNGCRIWEEWVNANGGMLIKGVRHPISIHAFDTQYDPELAKAGARELVENHNVNFIMTIGGDVFQPIANYLMDKKILTTTLLPSDLSPDTPYLIAPSEVHPFYNVTGVDWIKRNHPELKTVALCSQTDEHGMPSLASYRAAFKAAGIEILHEVLYDADKASPAEILPPMLAKNPDILCWCTSYTPMVHALSELAYQRGFQGKMISCTLDQYERLVEQTSVEFLEGTVFQFPDFDDPALDDKALFFSRPDEFYHEYNRRFPDSWSAVSWEYAATLDIWHAAVQKAESIETPAVLAAMKQLGDFSHAFGTAQWWGESMFGVNNALIGDWPVVEIQNGKARIVEFGSIPNWLKNHGEIMEKELTKIGHHWAQRHKRMKASVRLGERWIKK